MTNESAGGEMLAESIRLTHALHANGRYLHALPLTPGAAGARVTVRDGTPSVTDGPFVETHEQIAGYFFIEVESRGHRARHTHIRHAPGLRRSAAGARDSEFAGAMTTYR